MQKQEKALSIINMNMVNQSYKRIQQLHLKISLQPHERTKVFPHEAKRGADHHDGETFSEGWNPSLYSNSRMNLADLYVFLTLTAAFRIIEASLVVGLNRHKFGLTRTSRCRKVALIGPWNGLGRPAPWARPAGPGLS